MATNNLVMIRKQLQSEFQEILEKEYGVELSLNEAIRIGETLTSYFDLLNQINNRVNKNNN